MKLTRYIKISSKNLLINKRRSFLTMLGLIIGISSVILVMSAGAGAQNLITKQIQRRGTDQVVVLAGASDPNGPPAQALGIIITTLTEEDKDAMLNKANVAHVDYASGYITGNDTLRWENVDKTITFTGANADYEVVEAVTPAKGRFFTEAEAKEREHVVVLGDEIATDVFGDQDPIGQRVKIANKQFRVIGVLAPKESSIFGNADTSVIIPLQVAQYELLGVRHVTFIRMKLEGEEYIEQTEKEIFQLLEERHGEEDFSIRNTAAALDILTNITNALKFFLVAISAVSLFVGGVGIMNIMLIAVQEKTREVGLRKAVGAKNSDIMSQFLVETVLLSLLGGVIGLLIGIGMAYVIARVVQYLGYQYDFIISASSIVISIGVTTLIGIIFGVYPAKKAAKLDPIDALRYQ